MTIHRGKQENIHRHPKQTPMHCAKDKEKDKYKRRRNRLRSCGDGLGKVRIKVHED